ncbi:MAG: hypothetical protein ACR2J4_03515 [Deinococcus sp.]
MGRMERFARYTFAPWPDEGLREAVRVFRRPYVTRADLRFDALTTLLIELKDSAYSASGETGEWVDEHGVRHADPNGSPGTLRLSWERPIFALESYDEFYSRPYAHAYAWRKENPSLAFLEIVSEPDAWIQELLADNPDTGVFPTSGTPVMVRDDLRAQNPSWPEPTGRFYPPGGAVDLGLDVLISFAGTPIPRQMAEMRAEAEKLRAQREAEARTRPRYRHLFIASESHMLEVLCEALPRWEWRKE